MKKGYIYLCVSLLAFALLYAVQMLAQVNVDGLFLIDKILMIMPSFFFAIAVPYFLLSIISFTKIVRQVRVFYYIIFSFIVAVTIIACVMGEFSIYKLITVVAGGFIDMVLYERLSQESKVNG